MIYLVIALRSEAQAFVDKYRLTKTKLGEYVLYHDKTRTIIISGMGVSHAREATQTLINNFDISDEDIFVNIGICGAKKDYKIGSLLEIGEVIYDGMPYMFEKSKKSIICVDGAISEEKYKIVDMESYGFLDAVMHSPAIKTFHILKV
ncbi:MAG: hypothetical protein Q9M34_09575, partial [Sulfurimonas sp.]|nr:hypothetical protein [Sulfurimonas sp.]